MKLRVKQVAKQKGIKQQDIAARMNITPQTLANTLYHGNPTLGTLAKIASILEVPVWMLLASPEEVLKDIAINVRQTKLDM